MWEDVYSLFEPRGVSVYDLASEMADQDYTAVRADECCHFNALGHRILAERFEAIVMNELQRSAPHTRRSNADSAVTRK